jgi:hypothetical protein
LQALDASQVVLALRDFRAGAGLFCRPQRLHAGQFRLAQLALEFGRIAGVVLFVGSGDERGRCRAGGQQADRAEQGDAVVFDGKGFIVSSYGCGTRCISGVMHDKYTTSFSGWAAFCRPSLALTARA